MPNPMTEAATPPANSSSCPEASANCKETAASVRVQARIAIVAQVIREHGGRIPSQFELLRALRQRGVKTSKGTVMNDLFALGICNAPSAYPRRRAITSNAALSAANRSACDH
jgi:hypothetical protein